MTPNDIANNWDDFPEIQRSIGWRTADINEDFVIYQADEDGVSWMIRLNDFPDEPLFTILRDNTEVMRFDDWPRFWNRPSKIPPSKISLRNQLEAFVKGEEIAIETANEMEGDIIALFPDDHELIELAEMLAQYQPGGGEYLYSHDSIKTKAEHYLRILAEHINAAT